MFNLLHLELTSRCNKSCWMCGRRKLEQENPEMCDWGDMDHDTVHKIALQTPRGTLVQMHNNGEPLLYPYLGWALLQFKHCIRQFNTNGKLLVARADEIIDNLEVLTISVIENDPEGDEQYDIVRAFIKQKGDRAPRLVFRLLGESKTFEQYQHLTGTIARRTLHSPLGSFSYRRSPTIPETGICLDLLTHLAVDRYGNISLCVRLDPEGKLRLGNINTISLSEAWYGEKRKAYIREHVAGRRKELPGCGQCDFYGVPTG